MPRLVSSQAIVEVRLMQRMAGQRLMNVLHYRLGVDGASIIDGDDVVEEAMNVAFTPLGKIIPILKGVSNAAWTYDGAVWQWIYPNRFSAITKLTGAGPGETVGLAAPPNVSSTLTKKALEATKHGRGSLHIGGMTSTDITLGLLSVDRTANMVDLADLLTVDIDVSAVLNALELTPIILNKSSPQLSLPFHEMLIQNTSRVQRRRTVGLGI